jgi:hypothetical protein
MMIGDSHAMDTGEPIIPAASWKMNTLVDQVVWKGKTLGGFENEETCIVMTRRIRWLWPRSRTTVLPGDDCNSTPGFIVWWNSNDPVVLQRVHTGMVQLIQRVGFTEPAVWCDRRHENRSRDSLPRFWKDKLGDLFSHYRKAT